MPEERIGSTYQYYRRKKKGFLPIRSWSQRGQQSFPFRQIGENESSHEVQINLFPKTYSDSKERKKKKKRQNRGPH